VGGGSGTALTSLLTALPPLAPSEAGGGGGGSRDARDPFRAGGAGDGGGERHPTAAAMQGRTEAAVKQSAELAEKAVAAFQAFSRAYAAYPKALKHIFHPKVRGCPLVLGPVGRYGTVA